MSEIIDLCQKLIQFSSCDSQVEGIMSFLQEYFDKYGFDTQLMVFRADNGKSVTNLCASYGKGHPHLLFVGHADVVSAGCASDWKHSPFEGVVDDGVLYGRGIADMKGGIACFAKACVDFISSRKFSGKITVVISGDEEEPIVEGADSVLKKLSNSGENFDFCLVGEPSNPKTMGDEIKIGRRGDMVLKITSFGQQGHTAYTDSLSNPVFSLINLLYNMQNDKLDGGNDYFSPSVVHVTTFDVGNSASNVVPSKASAVVDIRFNSEQTFESIENWVNNHVQKIQGDFKIDKEYIGNSFLSRVDNHIQCLRNVVKKNTGHLPIYSTAGGTSDARFVSKYCPVAEYGLTNATIHKINECEQIKNIETLYNVYKDFLIEFFSK